MPISVPSDERRVHVRTFGYTVSTLLTLPWFVLAFWTHHGWPVIAGGSVASMAAIVMLVREDLVWRVYAAWNRRLVRPFASSASAAVLAICYSVVVLTAKAKARQDAGTDLRSSWVSRRSLPINAYHALFAGSRRESTSAGWVANYIRWARETHNLWATSLLPFLAILKLLSKDEAEASHENIYTLF